MKKKLAYLENDVIDLAKVPEVFLLEVRVALILDQRGKVPLGTGHDLIDLEDQYHGPWEQLLNHHGIQNN